jgi:hypothetical protein
MLRRTVFLLAACASVPLALAQLSLDKIREDWGARKYPATYEETEIYRKQPYGKRLEVYYMGGTSLCRMRGQTDLGTKYMQWILDNFSMSQTDFTTVQGELQACQSAAVPVAFPMTIVFNTTLAVASSAGRTKMFYYDGGNNALKSVPVEVVREIPREELDKRLFGLSRVAEAKDLVNRLAGTDAVSEASKYFVVVSRQHPPEVLHSIGKKLDQIYDFFVSEYAMRPPEYLISVYLVTNASDLQRLSTALHGIRLSPQSIGYSYQADMSMVGMVQQAATGTLQHELFHLMVRNNFGDVPPWMDEGMAALYEVAETRNGRVVGVENWRGPVLDTLWRLQPPVEQLIKMNWFQFSGGDKEYNTDRQAAIHSKARYFMLYLQNQGKLHDVYRAFQAREIGTDSAELLSSTVRQDLGALESDFDAWFRKTNR